MPDHDYSTFGRSAFEHQPLDYNSNSVRLLRILPGLSHDGLIQCELWHATVEHEHDCLSYEWVLAGKRQEMLINGKCLKVSEHLWSFLKVHGPNYAASRRPLWIDFICIHQECISELNHQIPLMSRLYSSAHRVVTWLGFSERIERTFAFWRELNTLQPQTHHETNILWHSHIRNKNAELKKDWQELAKHSYWRRAWITQEILCAKKLKLLINDSEVVLGPVPGISRLLLEHDTPSDLPRTYTPWHTFQTYLEALCGSETLVGRKLVELFHLLPGRESSKPRDRIYSLLSIASDGDLITIDYNNSDEDVFLQLLEAFKQSACPCLVAYMAQALEIRDSRTLSDVSEHVPLFRIAVKEAYLKPKTHHALDSESYICSECKASVTGMGPGVTVFCTHSRTHCLRNTHLYVQQHWTDDNKKKYKIKSEYCQAWFDLFSVGDKDWFTICIEKIRDPVDDNRCLYLTAGVAIRLVTNISRSCQPDEVIELCEFAQKFKGYAALCTKSEVETESGSEPCCSNSYCLRVVYLKNGYVLPAEYWNFRLSDQYIQHEIQNGTWSSPLVMRRFLEDDGPWVPFTIKHPHF